MSVVDDGQLAEPFRGLLVLQLVLARDGDELRARVAEVVANRGQDVVPASAAIPLTLRTVGGLTTAEIARAFLVPEPAMGKRIARAKQRIRDSQLPFELPGAAELPDRLRAICTCST